MEFTLMWFWAIKLGILAVLGYVSWQFGGALAKGKRRGLWGTLTLIVFLFSMFAPIKMEQSKLTSEHNQQNVRIEQAKVLPDMVDDNSFDKATKNAQKIKEVK